MFGKTLIKMVGLMMGGAIALAAGAQILTSAIAIVVSFRYGNPVPMMLVAVSAVILLRTPRLFKDNGPFRTLQMVLAYAISTYLTLVVFIFLLPYGIIASLAGSSFAVIICSLVHDPREIQRFATGISLRDNARALETFGRSSKVRASATLELEAMTRMHVFLFPHGHEDKIVTIMRERPLLPISITRYEDFSVVVTSNGTSAKLLHQIKQMLKAAEIDIDSRVSPLFLEAIVKLPLIDAQFGLSMKEFCYV
ncbi:MAG: hypothetical protein EAX95_15780, partial [Candidatus Thorarchaeota archaeon]|nr:hypothetical protein [Candidatus Thorarchaeota archaeon]